MKKIISMMVAMLMVIGLLPTVTMASTAEHILLSGENFNMPTYTNGGYMADDSSAYNELFANSMKINENGNINPSTARVYIDEAGTYNLWVLSGNTTKDNDRYAKVRFDDQSMQNLTPHQHHEWEKTEWALTKGWHNLKVGIGASWEPVFVNALYITNDLTYVPNTDTDNELLAYHDTTAPVFEASADVEATFANGALNVKFPEANDENDVMYEYTVGNTTTAIEDITQPVAVSGVVGTVEIVLTAFDKWGHITEKTFSVTGPRTKWMLTWNNFVKPDYTSWTIEWANSLVNYSIYPNTLLADPTGSTKARAKAQFYVEESGNYAVHVLSQPTEANRIPKLWVNNTATSATFHTDKAWAWDKVEVTLNKGWNTVEFGLNAWSPYYLNAIYITSDLTETVTTDNDDALLAYGDSSVNIDGELYMACGLEKAGYVTENSSINVTPVNGKANTLTSNSTETVTVNNTAAAWDTAVAVTLDEGITTVTVDSSDDSADCTFKVASTGAIINHVDAAVTGKVDSAYAGADGSNAISLENGGSAKFSAQGISGNTEVWAYVIAATEDSSAATDASVTIVSASGTSTSSYSNRGSVSAWVKLGEYNFSGSSSEYVEIAGQADANVYVDSIKFKSADEYIVSAPATIEADGKIKFVYECYKQTDSAAVPVAIIAEYEGTAMNSVSVNEISHSTSGIYTISTNALNKASGAEYRSFIWESISNLTPLR